MRVASTSVNFWTEEVSTSVNLMNRLPIKTLQDMTAYKALCGNKPSVNYIKIFRCVCYYRVPETKRNKQENKAHKGILMGYNSSK